MAIGWNRVDLEGLQPVDSTPGHGLHPAQSLRYAQQQQQQQHDPDFIPLSAGNLSAITQHYPDYQDTPTRSSATKDTKGSVSEPKPVPVPVPGDADFQQNDGSAGRILGSEPRILGLRRTTFFLTLSNILLAIGLIVLGVVQSQASKDGGGASAQSCLGNGTAATGTSGAPSTLPTCAPEEGKICFASNKSTTTAIVLGEVNSECPISASKANYTVPGTNLTFKRSCGTDQAGDDMGRFPVLSMLDCITLCAQLNLYPASALGRCTGVSWAYGDGAQGKGIAFCYPKTNLRPADSSKRAGTESAALIE